MFLFKVTLVLYNVSVLGSNVGWYCCRFERRLHVDEDLWTHDGGGSGGYLHHIAVYAAEQLAGLKLDKLHYKVMR